MLKALKLMMIAGSLLAPFAGASVAQAATPPAAMNNMMAGAPSSMTGMMGRHDKANSMGDGDMMAMMTSCTNMMVAQTNMMNAKTNELNAQTNALTHSTTASAPSK